MVKLSEMELKALIQGGETNTVELKVAAPRATEMAERLCGMANAQGGVVIIGVKDSHHEIVGVPDHRIGETLDVILRAVRQMIKPELVLDPLSLKFTRWREKARCGYGEVEPWTSLSGSRDLLGEARYPYRFVGVVRIVRDGERPGLGGLGTSACS